MQSSDGMQQQEGATGGLSILFVAGDRVGGARQETLKTPDEYKAIKDAISRGTRRDEFALLSPLLATTTRELVMGLAQDLPGILHFAGHGHERTLTLLDGSGHPARFTEDEATQLFGGLSRTPMLVVLTACRSLALAKRLLDHVEFAIGVEGDLDDDLAIQFAGAFYQILAQGHSLGSTFELALVAAKAKPGATAPVLVVRDGTDPAALKGPQGNLLARASAWRSSTVMPHHSNNASLFPNSAPLPKSVLSKASMPTGESKTGTLPFSVSTREVQVPVRQLQLDLSSTLTTSAARSVEPPNPPAPPLPTHSSYNHSSVGALALLAHCDEGIPTELLAEAMSAPSDDLNQELQPLLIQGYVSFSNNEWRKARHWDGPQPPNVNDILANGLRVLLAFIKAHKSDGLGVRQVDNAIALARQCHEQRPDAVLDLFDVIEKHLKRRGNKRLVYDMANLVIAASYLPLNKGDHEARCRAQALICGRSWALQRRGHLEKANAAATESLNQGEAIGWDRNTAFCLKCMGRLFRVQAEQADGNLQVPLLQKSEEHLKRAIKKFNTLAGFGNSHPQVGECFSLLGRTYLVWRQLSSAETVVREALKRITDKNDKAYLDLCVLIGDLQVAKQNASGALTHFKTAIDSECVSDTEVSEIRARALLARGKCLEALRDKTGALEDYRAAAKLYETLDEPDQAAEATWCELLLSNEVPKQGLALLAQERRASVRVAVVRLYKSGQPPRSAVTRGRRDEPPRASWQQWIQKAAAEYVYQQKSEW